MPFEIVRNDISKMQVDAIVNAASRRVRINPGVDSAVHKKAGPQLLEARRAIGDIAIGDAAITPAFGLDAEYVIHAPSPIWFDGTKGETTQLSQDYLRCLALAIEKGCETIAFPLLGAGNHGFPKDKALQTAVNVFSSFLLEHEMHIYLVVLGKESFALSGKLFRNVKSFIDEYYVDEYELETYSLPRGNMRIESCRTQSVNKQKKEFLPSFGSTSVEENDDLTIFLKKKDASFAVTLVSLIEKSGKTNSQVYKKANVDRKLFSKIINNVNYHPTKQTAVALALALELSYEQTQDLIGRAGYTLTRSSKFDLVIEYFLRKKYYNIFEINEVLYDFDLPLLGC